MIITSCVHDILPLVVFSNLQRTKNFADYYAAQSVYYEGAVGAAA